MFFFINFYVFSHFFPMLSNFHETVHFKVNEYDLSVLFKMCPSISITGSVRPSVGWSVGRLVGDAFVKNKGNQYFHEKYR